MSGPTDTSTTQHVSFPAAIPHPQSEGFLSMFVRAEGIEWGLHDLKPRDGFLYAPHQMWRTSRECIDSSHTSYRKKFLLDLMPQSVKARFAGGNARTSKDVLSFCLQTKEIPFWTVHVFKGQAESADDITAIFCDLPCQIFWWKATDFFPIHPFSKNMDPSGIASLHALRCEQIELRDEMPILFIDTSFDQLYYAGTDETGEILGEGKAPISFPGKHFGENDSSVSVLSAHNQPNHSGFACSLLGSLTEVVSGWKSLLHDPSKFVVHVCGPHANIVRKTLIRGPELLQHVSKAIINDHNTLEVHSCLAPFGVEAVLRKEKKRHSQQEPDLLDLVGSRVASESEAGTVANILGDVRAQILFDSGKVEEVLCSALFTMLQNYCVLAKSERNPELFPHKRIVTSQVSRDTVKKFFGSKESNKEQDPSCVENAPCPPPLKKHKLAAPDTLCGVRIAKFFGKRLYFGTVQSVSSATENAEGVKLWHILYDDDDKEDFDEDELREQRRLYNEHKDADDKLTKK